MAMESIVSLLIIEEKPFCLSASPDKQKIISLRSRRLCGENVILDKHVFIHNVAEKVKPCRKGKLWSQQILEFWVCFF
jgi:hypothetical protein